MSAGREKLTIRSLTNPRVKQAIRLRNASTRRKTGRFLIDGWREIELAVKHGIELETVFYAGDLKVLDTVRKSALQPVAGNVLERLSYGQLADSPVAVAVAPELVLTSLPELQGGLVLVLDRTEKPGNLGACLRSASAAGAEAVILSDPICELFNPNTIRASRGAVFTLPIAVCGPKELIEFCRTNKLLLYCGRVDAPTLLWECDFKRPAAVVFGSEAHGLGQIWAVADAQAFRIPMQGATDSLNLSISAAVTLYEAVRQRSKFDQLH